MEHSTGRPWASLGAAGVALVASLGGLALGCPGTEDGLDAGREDAVEQALDATTPRCDGPPGLAVGGSGMADPVPVPAGRAVAGRIATEDLPSSSSGLAVWEAGDFVLANEHVALLIEDVDRSDLYDPWGGRPVGIARVENGRLVGATDFGEMFLLEGRYTVLTEHVSVLSDGSDGGPAVVRAVGWLRPLPFFEELTRGLLPVDLSRVRAAIDYVLEPGSHHVDVFFENASGEARDLSTGSTLHGFLYAERTPPFASGSGFSLPAAPVDWIAWVDDRGASWIYEAPGGSLGAGVSTSGFVGRIARGFVIPACSTSRRLHARLTVGDGDGLDAVLAVHARENGRAIRRIEGVVREADGTPARGARVFAADAEGILVTRSLPTAEDGQYRIHVPEGATVRVSAWRRGARLTSPVEVTPTEERADLTLGVGATLVVSAVDDVSRDSLPVRVSVFPVAPSTIGAPPASWGEALEPTGRLVVEYAHEGRARIPVPEGRHRVVVSRGFEYELFDTQISVDRPEEVAVRAVLRRVVDTTNVQCGDFHIHTRRSADAADDARLKVRAAVADGLEIPVRSDHEYVADFSEEITALGLERWASSISSIEMTSMEVWGHMGVFPLEALPGERNAGAPRWQEFPEADAPDAPLRTMSPVEVFEAVRARPERPTVIINHPMGSRNYFGYVGFDPITGMVARPSDWDDEFSLVEVFNDSGWVGGAVVPAWLGLLDHGRRVFAVGSSDSHALRGSPVGYPRTCIDLGTDDPRDVTPTLVRDRLLAGRATISGGIYVDAWAGPDQNVGPGGDARGLGPRTTVRVRVQAASWVDVDALDVVLDGRIVATLPIVETDADPDAPHVRFDRSIPLDVAGGDGSYVIFAAYGDAPLEPVLRGRVPFGVTNPIFLHR